ncbi:ferredoxin [Methylobacterium sp. NEAU 140]|uniref:ferredoxin n=1 Tax=Methylobacterium sp. NEAU 140 TaxID=3064945 RepID=UPI0027370039|nr:ferredoxin [Methylobacterium sp. NEAU 140]MDP4022498.1 ferredoxin [Methylobacterium sp. NEAU 140]
MSASDGRDPALRIVVDLNRCQGYAQCCYAAPGAFVLRGHEILFYDPSPPAHRRGEIERAVLACPVRAIAVQTAADEEDVA